MFASSSSSSGAKHFCSLFVISKKTPHKEVLNIFCRSLPSLSSLSHRLSQSHPGVGAVCLYCHTGAVCCGHPLCLEDVLRWQRARKSKLTLSQSWNLRSVER